MKICLSLALLCVLIFSSAKEFNIIDQIQFEQSKPMDMVATVFQTLYDWKIQSAQNGHSIFGLEKYGLRNWLT